MKKYLFSLFLISFQLWGDVQDSSLPILDSIYDQEVRINNINQQSYVKYAAQHQAEKLRIMTYNMLYNIEEAENKLPLKHRWAIRMPRLLEYLEYAKADIIGSQELQEDQVADILSILSPTYEHYGLKTRENEGRSDTNAIFFNKKRFELLEAKTIFYEEVGGNAFTYCLFKDRFLNKNLVVINTKLSWGISWQAMKKRSTEANKLSEFLNLLPACNPIVLVGDFNTLYFLDGKSVLQILTKSILSDSMTQSILKHCGPFCSINNSKILLTPFTGPELTGVILDRIFINEKFIVMAHAIDEAKVNGEYPSDHFPVIADLFFK